MRKTSNFLCAVAVCSICVGALLAVNPTPLQNAYWRFEEGSAGEPVSISDTGCVLDGSGNENNMGQRVAARAPSYTSDVPAAVVPGRRETNRLALRFDGVGQCIYTTEKPINNALATALTLEASFKADAVGNDVWHAVVVRENHVEDASSDAPVLSLMIRGDDGRLMLLFRDKSNNIQNIRSLAPLEVGRWYHVAFVAGGTRATLYLHANDGQGYQVQGAVTIQEDGPLYQNFDGAGFDAPWAIGRGMWSRTPDEWFAGVIDEVRLSNQALSPAQFLWFDQNVPGDLDGDLDVDDKDGATLRACMTGPCLGYTGAMPSGCVLAADTQGLIAADIDADGDVDQDDFSVWQRCYSGIDKPGNPKCNS